MTSPFPGLPAGGGSRSSLDRVRDALQARGSKTRSTNATQVMAACPVHDDGTPSLSVRWVHGQRGGTVLLNCHGCGARAADLVEPLGLSMADLFDEPLPPRVFSPSPERAGRSVQQRRNGRRRGRVGRLPQLLAAPSREANPEPEHAWTLVETYPYVDAGGLLVQEVVREECTACPQRHKQFRQVFAVDGRQVRRKPAGFAPVLYRLPQVIDAVAGAQPVWLVEGEKDVHTAERLGLVATTNAQGGRAFPAELAEVFRGADVRVVLDRDDAGWDRGVGVHEVLTGVGARVQLLLPAPSTAKADFTDHVEAGGDVGGLLPVHVEEVSAWALAATARRKHATVEQALAQTLAQLAAAQDAGKGAAADERRRFARRWAVESEIRWEALRDLVDDVRRQVARTGTDWAGDAIEAAEETLRQATTAARAAHQAVGLAVPPVLQLPAPSPPGAVTAEGRANEAGEEDPRWPPRPGSRVRDGLAIDQPSFRIVDGNLVQVEPVRRRRDQDWGDDEDAESLKLVLSLDVRVVEMEYLEDPDTVDVDTPRLLGREVRAGQAALNPPGPAQLSAVVVAYTHPVTGECMQMRVPAEEYNDCGWLESLPGPPDYDAKPSGLATVRRAIKAVSAEIRTVTRYRWTGWRVDEGGRWFFVHAGGAITPEGPRPVPVLLSGPLARYDLPDPSTDPGRLRAAFVEHSAGMLEQLPARVAAPLLGQVYRSAMGPNPWVLALIGSAGSYKTSLASLAMHHWGELWDRRKPATSMSGNGDTLNALRIKLNSAKDALYWADDVAPTRDWAGAQKTLEEFARLVHNGEQRSRATRDGLSVLDGTPPRSSALITSEVMPRPGSGAQRILVVPLNADEISLDQLIDFDADESRHGRALLMASMLRWLAGDLEGIRGRCLAEAARYAEQLREGGEGVRLAEAAGHTWAGWVAMTEFLLAAGAIAAEERDRVLDRVDRGLRDALVATADPDLPSRTGARVRELICHALRTGLAYVEDVRTGEAPPWPMAGRLGWRRTPMGTDDAGQPRYRVESRGIRFGYVLHDPSPRDGAAQLLVESTGVEQVLKATGITMADAPQIDRGTALRALHDEGVLIAEERKGRTPRYTVQRTLHCEDGRRQRMTALRLAELLGDDRGDDPVDGPGAGGGEGGAPPDGGGLFGPPTGDAAPPVSVPLSAQGLTGPEPEERAVAIHADAEGTSARAEITTTAQPCLLCDVSCSVLFLGIPLHIPCWWHSTAGTRAAAAGARAAGRASSPAAAAAGEDGHAAPPAPAAAPPVAPPQPRRRSAATTVTRFAAPAAVLHTDGVWMPDGTRHDLPDPLHHVGHIAGLVEVLELGTQVTDRRAEPGQVWVTAEVLAKLGIDVNQLPTDATRRVEAVRTLTKGAELVTAAIADGWQLGGAGNCLSAWTRVWRGEQRGVWVALIPAMNADPAELPVLGDAPTPATLARRLALFAGGLRAPWAMSPATTGLDLMISLRARDREKLFAPREPVPPARISTLEQDFSWSRPPTTEEREQRFVHAYDRGGSYAAGIAGLELGIGKATHHPEGREFDRKLPGYWKYEVPQAGDWRMPHPLNPRGGIPLRPVWATTPGMQLAYELGYTVPILEAYVWEEHGRVLDPWYERVRDARTALDVVDVDAQAARNLLKVMYTRTIGMLGSEEWMRNRAGYAPDRRHHIVAKARSNILRRILQIGQDSGRWPVAVTADTVLYVADDPDPVAAWPGKPEHLGRGFGQFKAEASGLLADQLPHLQGRDYRGKELLDHAWQLAAAAARRAS